MDYQQQLKDKRWRIKAIRFKVAKNMTCELCGSLKFDMKFLHIHHKKYKPGRMAWEYENEELICVCNCCHRKIHNTEIIDRKLESTRISKIIGYDK